MLSLSARKLMYFTLSTRYRCVQADDIPHTHKLKKDAWAFRKIQYWGCGRGIEEG